MKEKITFRSIWGIISPILVYYLIQVALVNLGYLLIHFLCNIRMQGSDLQTIERAAYDLYRHYVLHLNLLAGMIAIPIFLFWYSRDDAKSLFKGYIKKYEMVNPLKYSFVAFLGLSTMMAANYFVSLLMQFMPDFMIQSYEDTGEILNNASIGIQVLSTVVIAPIVEELIFRGLVFSKIRRISNVKIAAVLSALLFGIYHGNWIQAPYAFLMGLAAAYVYEKYKNILAPILLHASANLFSALILYYAIGANTESAPDLSNGVTAALLLMLTVFMTGFVILFGVIIHWTVKPKEVSDEIVDHYNSML